MSMLERVKSALSPGPQQIVMNGVVTSDNSPTGLLQGIYPASRGEPPQRGTQDRLEAYNQMPWLRACAERVAASVASTQWQLFFVKRGSQVVRHRLLERGDFATRKAIKAELKERNELIEIDSHPFLDMLDNGNSFLTGLSSMKVTQLHIDLAGEAFWLKERAQGGVLKGLMTAAWPIPPHWILGTPTPTWPFFRVGFRAWVGDIPASEILWMPNPDPKFPYGRGSGLGGALADELETDEYASRFLKQFFYNDATPPFVVSPKGQDANSVILDAEARRLEYSWLAKLQGYWKSHKPMFMNRAVDVYEFKREFRSMQLVQLREHERDVVMQVFGIPPEILGVLSNSNRATIDSADYIYTTKCQIPRLDFLRAYMQEKLLPEYDPRLVLDYVSPVQDDKAAQLDAAKTFPYVADANELRAFCGLPEAPGGKGLHFVPFQMNPSPSLASLALQKPAEGEPMDLPLNEHPDDVTAPAA